MIRLVNYTRNSRLRTGIEYNENVIITTYKKGNRIHYVQFLSPMLYLLYDDECLDQLTNGKRVFKMPAQRSNGLRKGMKYRKRNINDKNRTATKNNDKPI